MNIFMGSVFLGHPVHGLHMALHVIEQRIKRSNLVGISLS